MNTTRAAARILPIAARCDTPAPAATDLAHALLENGWTLSGVAVRTIHTARLTDASGLTIAVSSEAGDVRLDFNSEGRYLTEGVSRPAWYAEATAELPVEVLAAVVSANVVAFGDDREVGDVLTDAGWRQPYPGEPKWIGFDGAREVRCIDHELEATDLPWEIRQRAGRRVTIHASADTPAAVIAALALTQPTAHTTTGTG